MYSRFGVHVTIKDRMGPEQRETARGRSVPRQRTAGPRESSGIRRVCGPMRIKAEVDTVADSVRETTKARKAKKSVNHGSKGKASRGTVVT